MKYTISWLPAGHNCFSEVCLDGSILSPCLKVARQGLSKLDIFCCTSECCWGPDEEKIVQLALDVKHSQHSVGLPSPVFASRKAHAIQSRVGKVAIVAMEVRILGDKHPQRREVEVAMGPRECPDISCALLLYEEIEKVEVRISVNQIPFHSSFFKARNTLIEPTRISTDTHWGHSNHAAFFRKQYLGKRKATQINYRWKTTGLLGSSSSSVMDIHFNDRYPELSGLTGIRAWRGFGRAECVFLRKVSFWHFGNCIMGIQSTYCIDGKEQRGPRRRLLSGYKRATEYRLVLDNEFIRRVRARRNPSGTLACILLETSLGRTFEAGVEGRKSDFEDILLPPDSIVISFFGVLNHGMTCLGVTYSNAESTREISRPRT